MIKVYIDGIEQVTGGGTVSGVSSVNGRTGDVTLSKSDVNLSNVQNVDTTISSNITYDNTISGLSSTNVKTAIDEVVETLGYNSFGVVTIPTITKNGDGSITIGNNGVFNFVKVANGDGVIVRKTLTGTTLTPTDNTVNYLYADYNNGSPIYALTLSPTVFLTEARFCPITRITREGIVLHFEEYDQYGVQLSNKLLYKDVAVNSAQRQTGLVLSTSATRIASVTSGSIWFGVQFYNCGTVTSGTIGNMFEYYLVGGVWNKSSNQASFDSTYYSDGTNRQTMASNRYVSKYFWRDVGDDNEIYYIHGNEYMSSSNALAERVPVAPTIMTAHSIYLGKIVIQQGATLGTAYPRAWEGAISVASATNHEDLTNILQAGTGVTNGHISDGTQTIYGTKTFNTPIISTTANLTNSTNKNLVTDAEKTAITHSNRTALDSVSGTNTGDETKSSIESKLTGTITSHNHSGVYEPINTNITKAGNTFNGVSQLVQTDASGKLPAIDGSQLTNLPTGEIATMTNVGTGTGQIYKTKVGSDFKIKTIKAGTGVVITNGTDDITIDATGAGGAQSKSWLSYYPDSVLMNYGGNIFSIYVDNTYIYAGGGTTQTVRKYLKSDLSYIGETAIYGGTINSIFVDDIHIYVGGATTYTVRKYLKSDLSYIGETPSYSGQIKSIYVDDTHIYAAGSTTNTVRKYLKSDLSYIGETPSYSGQINSIYVDDTHIYAGGGTTQTVRKYLKSDLSYIGETANYGGVINSIFVDDTHIYAGGATTTTVRKYLKSDLSYIGETASYGGIIYSILVDDTHIYVGGATTYTVRKYLKSNLSSANETITYGGAINTMFLNDDAIYVGGATTNKVFIFKTLTSDL